MLGIRSLTYTVAATVAVGGLVLSGMSASAQTMKTAADVGYVPHVMASPSGGLEGINVDMMAEVAKRMGIKHEIVDQEWSAIFAGLYAKKYDTIIAPTTVTKERADKMLFSEGYMDVDFQFLLKKKSPQITSLDDLKGKTIAVNKGNFFDRWLVKRQDKYGWKILRFGKNAEAIQAVVTGRAYANFAGSTVMGWTSRKNPLLVPSTLIIESGLVGAFVFRLDSADLRAKFEKVLECMKKDGTVGAIHEKWTGQKPRSNGASYVVQPGIGHPDVKNYDPKPHGGTC
jgi:polar amino acid transport system substrate-binding protein